MALGGLAMVEGIRGGSREVSRGFERIREDTRDLEGEEIRCDAEDENRTIYYVEIVSIS